MEEREKSEKSYRFFRRIYDFSMSTLILGIGLLLLGASYLKIDMILNVDNEFRLIFGTMCIVYGGFRLYRAVKQDY
jgi:hypothetical protein